MKYLLATTALVALTAAASATNLDWNFQDHLGVLGNTQTFTAGGFDLTAKGFTAGDAGTALFSKNGGGDENGLGLNNDPSGNGEISFGHGFVQINLDGILGQLLSNGFSFQMGSTTQNEGWKVFGSEDAHPFTFTLLASSTDPGGQEGFHTVAGGWDNYNFFYSGAAPGLCGSGCNANVLLTNFDAVAVPGPIVGAGLPGLIAAGMAMLGLNWKRRRRNGVVV